LTGTPISARQTQWSDGAAAGYRRDPILIGLDWPVDAINRRINMRVKEMFLPDTQSSHAETLPDEVRRLDALGLLGTQAREALGYKQVLQALAGSCSMDEAIEQTKIQTRRFAKRQRTWLKRFRGVRWLLAENQSPQQLAELATQSEARSSSA
jgi:tRNA dimethylallyltransferase